MVKDEFRLPSSGYQILTTIIQGYLKAGGEGKVISLGAVADVTAMSRQHISPNNKFLSAIGILDREGRGYVLTEEGANLARVLSYRLEPGDTRLRDAWRTLISKNDFLRRVLSAVEIRGEMDAEAFAQHIALTSGVPYQKRYLTGARAVIDIFLAAAMLVKQNGALRIPPDRVVSQLPPESLPSTRPPQAIAVAPIEPQAGGMPLHLNLNLVISSDTADDELEAIAAKLKTFLRFLTATQTDES